MKTERRHVALFRNDLGGESFLFQNPRELIIAEEPGELLPGLERAEQAQRDGLWVAGYISYEAGYLLDPALTDLLPSQRDCPLLVLGTFDAPDTTYEPQADVTRLRSSICWRRRSRSAIPPSSTWMGPRSCRGRPSSSSPCRGAAGSRRCR